MNLLSRVKYVLKSADKPQREPAWLVGLVAVAIPLLVLGLQGMPAFLPSANAEEREGVRSAEGEAGPRRSVEQPGQRRSAEGEAGPRRSVEQPGQRRSAEGEAGPRRSAEGGARPQSGVDALQGFKPQSQREAALLQMILELRSEVSALRREVQSHQRGESTGSIRSGEEGTRSSVFGETGATALPERWQRTKAGQVFSAYDKNSDQVVSLEEWLTMTNGNVSQARREVQTQRFNEAEPSGDGKFTPAEFIEWYTKGRQEGSAGSRPSGARDGEGTRSGPRDGEGSKSGPRDGEGSKTGPRDGEGVKTGPRDGEGGQRGPRDGDR